MSLKIRKTLHYCTILLLLLLLCACGRRKQNSDNSTRQDKHPLDSIQTIHIAMLKGPSSMGLIQIIDSIHNASSTHSSTESTNDTIDPQTIALNSIANSTHSSTEQVNDTSDPQTIALNSSANSTHHSTEQVNDTSDPHTIALNSSANSTHSSTEQVNDTSDPHTIALNPNANSTHHSTEQVNDTSDPHTIALNSNANSTHHSTEQVNDTSDHQTIALNPNASSKSRLSIKIYTEPMLVRKSMLDGTADLAALPMNIAAILYNKGLEYSLVAVPVCGSLYLAGSDTTIKNWDDLRGRKIHIMAKGMTPDLLFRHLLAQNNISPEKDVILDYNFPTHTDMASALASGRAQLGVISEPYLSLVMVKNSEIRPLIDLNEKWKQLHEFDIPETAFVVKTKLLEEQPQEVESILNNYARSIVWVETHPESAAKLMVKHNIVSDTTAALSSISQTHLTFRRAKDYKNEIDAYLRILFEISPEIIGGKLPDEAFYK